MPKLQLTNNKWLKLPVLLSVHVRAYLCEFSLVFFRLMNNNLGENVKANDISENSDCKFCL